MMSVIRRLFYIGLVFPLISGLIFVYPWHRLFHFLPQFKPLSIVEITLLWLLPTLFFFIWIKTRTPTSTLLGLISVNWLGICLMFLIPSVVIDLANFFICAPRPLLATMLLAGGISLCLYAFYQASRFVIKDEKIKSDKLNRRYRLVQLSDLHLGSRSNKFISRIINKTNELKPDIVVITGDLFDMSRVKPESLEILKHLKANTYFITGNHDRYVGTDKHFEAIRQSGVVTLNNSSIVNNDLQIIGISDQNDPNQVSKILPSIELDHSKFLILLYHKPEDFYYVAKQRIDLMLSGHTHAGQIFPFNYLVKKQFPHFKGLLTMNNARQYVSQGTGTWGPAIRLGTVNEITVFELEPANK